MEFSMNLDTQDKNFAKTLAAEYIGNIKNKAYVNILGVTAFKNYLKDCDIKVDENSLIRIKKIYETTDIADVFANGVCIDVRTYTSTDALYVPKKHFENDLLPKYYVLAVYDEQSSQVVFKGYISSQNIDKSTQTNENYVVEQTKLAPMEELVQEIYNENPAEQNINAEELSGLFAALLDGQADKTQELKIIKLLHECEQGRKNLIEFSQFDFLAKNIANFPDLIDENAEGYEEQNEEQNKENPVDSLFVEEDGFDFIEAHEDDLTEDLEDSTQDLETLADMENTTFEENEDKTSDDDSSFAQTLAEAGMTGAAFAAGAAIGATAANAMDTADSLIDLTEDVSVITANTLEAAGDLFGGLNNSDDGLDLSSEDETENLFDLADDETAEDETSQENNEDETFGDNDDVLSLDDGEIGQPEEIEETEQAADEEEFSLDLNSEDDDMFSADNEDDLFAEEGQDDLLLEEDDELTEFSDTQEVSDENEENLLTPETDDETETQEDGLDALSLEDEEVIQEDIINDEELTLDEEIEPLETETFEIDEPNEEEIAEEQKSEDEIAEYEIAEDEIMDNDMDEIAEISEDEETAQDAPEIVEDGQSDEYEVPVAPEITEETDSVTAEDEYDYSDLDSLLDEIKSGAEENQSEENAADNANEQNLDTPEAAEQNTQVEDENIQTLFEQAPETAQEGDELNADEYAKYVQEPAANTKKSLILPVVGLIAAAAIVTGGVYSYHRISNSLSFGNQQPVTEAQMKSVDDFDDETFLEKSEMEMLANSDNTKSAEEGIAPNPDAIDSSDLNQSISNIFDETVYPVMISKIAWEIPETYTTSKYFKKYLQIAGVQLQRDLQANLAKVNEVSETGKIKISFDINDSSNIKNFKILETSGSKEIDTVVEKSVFSTLSYIKVPTIPSSENFVTLTLVINF